MQPQQQLIALISAVPAAIPPAQAAFDELLPGVTLWNVVDDRLLDDADGMITGRLAARMRRLIDHTIIEGADAVLVTCSMYATVAQETAADVSVPILGPDEALFRAAAGGGYRRVLVVSPTAESLADSLTRIRPAIGSSVSVEGVVADGAPAATRAGNLAALVESITVAVEAVSQPDVIVLGQYSLASAAAGVQAATGVPTLAGPHYAVLRLRARLRGGMS